MINGDIFVSHWRELRKNMRPRWPAITDAEVNAIDGHVDVLVDLLEEKYGYTRSLAEDEVNRFLQDVDGVPIS